MRCFCFSVLFLLFILSLPGHAEEEHAQAVSLRQRVIKTPSAVYPLNEPIVYQLQIQTTPEFAEQARLQAPVASLQNVIFLGLSQETVSEPSSHQDYSQILTLRFKALKAGKGEIKDVRLEWRLPDGQKAYELTLPDAHFKIKNEMPITAILAGFLLVLFAGGASIAFVRFIKARARNRRPSISKTLEETYLENLKQIRSETGLKNPSEFLGQLLHSAESYLQQKLDWNKRRDGYNTLKQKITDRYSPKEASELENWFKKTEEIRFSGRAISDRETIQLYEILFSWIEKRQVLN